MESGESYELEFVAHLAEFLREVRDSDVVELFLPVERWRTVVRQQLAWKFRMDGFCEFPRFREIRCRSLAPEHVGIGRVSEPARDAGVNAATELVEAFGRAFAVDEFPVARVRVGKQQPGGVRIRACDKNGGHAANVSGKTRRHQFFDELTRGHEDFAAEMAAFLRG